MTVGTWNLDFWKKTCTDFRNKEHKTEEEIHEYKEKSLNIIKDMGYDFLLLQETNLDFYFEDNSKTQWPYEYNHMNKIFYHQKFRGLNWGNAIVTNKKYKMLKNNINRTSLNDYYGKTGQMFCDFESINKKIITIINIYNKCKNSDWNTYYTTLENIIDEIEQIIRNKDNLIVLAGDFNGSTQPTTKFPNGDPKYIELFNKIKTIGFINCTENIGGTVSYNDYQNDYIFVKNCNHFTFPVKHIDEPFTRISDHYLIDCKIQM